MASRYGLVCCSSDMWSSMSARPVSRFWRFRGGCDGPAACAAIARRSMMEEWLAPTGCLLGKRGTMGDTLVYKGVTSGVALAN